MVRHFANTLDSLVVSRAESLVYNPCWTVMAKREFVPFVCLLATSSQSYLAIQLVLSVYSWNFRETIQGY